MPSGLPHVPEPSHVKRAWASDYRTRLIAEGDGWLLRGKAARANACYAEAREIARLYDLAPAPRDVRPTPLRIAA